MKRKNRSILVFLISLALLTGVLPLLAPDSVLIATEANAWKEYHEGPYCYSFDNEENTEIVLWEIDSEKTDDPSIPSYINGVPVTRLSCNFYSWKDVTKVTIPETVTSLTSLFDWVEDDPEKDFNGRIEEIKILNPLMDCSIRNFRGSGWYKALPDGPIYLDGIFLGFKGEYGKTVEQYTVEPGTLNIAQSAFKNCDALTEVTLPDSLIKICNSAFYGCKSLKKVNGIDRLTSLTTIDRFAFRDCAALEEIVLPDCVTTVGEGLFWGCGNLRKAKLSGKMTEIGENFFSGCSSLEPFAIPKNITSIGEYAFNRCQQFDTIELHDNITYIGSYAFSKTGWEMRQPAGLMYLHGNRYLYGYKGDQSVKKISLESPETVLIAGGAFSGLSQLEEIEVLPDQRIQYIGDTAFWNCEHLKSVDEIIQYAETIEYGAFWSCSAITSVNVPDTVTSPIGGFEGCSSLKAVTIGENVTAIGDNAFRECVNLETVTIQEPSHIKKIGMSAFFQCKNLTEFIITENVRYIGDGAFNGCENLKTLTIRSGLNRFPSFSNCAALKTLYIPATITEAPDRIFYNCSALTDIYFDGTSEQWNQIQADQKYVEGTGYCDQTIQDLIPQNVTVHFLEGAVSDENTERAPGDVDGNGKLEPSDARIALRASVGLDPITVGSAEFKAADADGNGKLEPADARLILRASVGLEDLADWKK